MEEKNKNLEQLFINNSSGQNMKLHLFTIMCMQKF